MASPVVDPARPRPPLPPGPGRLGLHVGDVVRWVVFLVAVAGLLLTTAPISFG